MALFIFRFWPVLIPLIMYGLWHLNVCRKAVAAGKPKPNFRDGPWYWAVLSSLLLGIICFLTIGLSNEAQKGNYQPAHIDHDTIVPAKVNP